MSETLNNGEETVHSQSYWSLVWVQLKKNASGMIGLTIIGTLFFIAVFAPLIANDRPIYAVYKGNTVYPAMTSYVDTWVPYKGWRNSLKSWKVGDSFPLSDYYAELEGQTWKEVQGTPDLVSDIWPPVPWHPTQFDPNAVKLIPNDEHLLGTDDRGQDVFARLIHGTVVAMLVGIISMSISSGIGIVLGVTAGYFGGWVDNILSRITEVVMCFPTFFLIIAAIAFWEPSIFNIMIILGLVGWTGIFRLIRGEVIAARNLEYITAAHALGIPNRRIMFRHILPNVVSPIFVSIAFGIAAAVLAETSLSFLGFGDTEVPSWGEIVQQGRTYVSAGLWHLTVYPGIAIFVTLTAFNLFGQGLRDAMDPKLRR